MFSIVDPIALEQALPQYFHTNKLKSFIRQLFLYNFKVATRKGVKYYHNLDFGRQAYHKIVDMKSKKYDAKVSQRTSHRRAYKLLQIKYDKLYASVLHMRDQVDSTITENCKHIMQVADFECGLQQRLRVLTLAFTTITLNFDNVTSSRMSDITMNQHNFAAISEKKYDDQIDMFNGSPELIKAYAEKLIVNPQYYSSLLGKKIRNLAKDLCEKYFTLPFSTFYPLFMEYVIDKRQSTELSTQPNQVVLLNIVDVYDSIINQVMTMFFSTHMQHIIANTKVLYNNNVLETGDERSVASTDTRFSKRTLRDILGEIDVDISKVFRFDIDD